MKNSGTKSTSSTAKTKKKTPAITTTSTSSSSMNGSQLKPIQESSIDYASPRNDDSDHSTPLKDSTGGLNSTFTKEESSTENSTEKEKGALAEHATKDVENQPPPHSTNSNLTTMGANSCTPTHNNHFHLMTGSALASTLAAKSHEVNGPQSYAMTPAESDPLYVYENYDIANLSSEDSTDDEECPRKV